MSTPAASPPLALIAPFFLAAPLGVIGAGLLLATADRDVFYAVNAPVMVAVTHALVIGWVTTTIMGATFQIGQVVLGGRLLSERLARIQFFIHIAAVSVFVWAVSQWDAPLMGAAGLLLVASFIAYILNAAWLVATAPRWTLARAYMGVALVLLVATFSLGITFAGTLEHSWFPISMGLLSAHAHLGLVGWIGITLMGVSFQLVPMFNLIQQARSRLGWAILAITAAGVVTFAAVIVTNPAAPVRLAAAAGLALGPALWAGEQMWLFAQRSRRRLSIHGRATVASLTCLVLTIALGLAASTGTPLTDDAEQARWLLAYGAAGVLGWAGCALIGNTAKIVPFLIWFHRYANRVGREPVPSLGEIASERLATGLLLVHLLATLLLIAGALGGSLVILQLGGLVLAGAGVGHAVALGLMFLPRQPASPAVTHQSAASS